MNIYPTLKECHRKITFASKSNGDPSNVRISFFLCKWTARNSGATLAVSHVNLIAKHFCLRRIGRIRCRRTNASGTVRATCWYSRRYVGLPIATADSSRTIEWFWRYHFRSVDSGRARHTNDNDVIISITKITARPPAAETGIERAPPGERRIRSRLISG